MLGDNPQVFAAIGFQPDVTYETARGGGYNEDRILAWEKAQDLRSGAARSGTTTFRCPIRTARPRNRFRLRLRLERSPTNSPSTTLPGSFTTIPAASPNASTASINRATHKPPN